jgi:hypothetical protein
MEVQPQNSSEITLEEKLNNIVEVQRRLDAGEVISASEVSPLTHSQETVVLAALSRRAISNRL